MTDATLVKLNFESLREALQHAGYRVERVTDASANVVSLRSSTGGLAFDVHPGNRLVGDLGFADVAFVAALQTQGNLPLEVVNRWNATRRFARLQLIDAGAAFLMFTMDVSVAGGVTPAYLRTQIETWDRLAQDLVSYLRDEMRRLSGANGADARAGGDPPAPMRDGERVAVS
jgi:hypothetical protein